MEIVVHPPMQREGIDPVKRYLTLHNRACAPAKALSPTPRSPGSKPVGLTAPANVPPRSGSGRRQAACLVNCRGVVYSLQPPAGLVSDRALP
jgi:hypothetical protein